MGIWNIEAKYKEGSFESKVTINENFNKFHVDNIDFASISTPEDFEKSGRMLIELSKILNRING